MKDDHDSNSLKVKPDMKYMLLFPQRESCNVKKTPRSLKKIETE